VTPAGRRSGSACEEAVADGSEVGSGETQARTRRDIEEADVGRQVLSCLPGRAGRTGARVMKAIAGGGKERARLPTVCDAMVPAPTLANAK
jgi:hypothetical protein